MSKPVLGHPDDSPWVELDGMLVFVCRSKTDGALMIDVQTHDVGRNDEHPATGVPRLRLAINDYVAQLDVDGSWVDESPYPKLTVLDHIAEATR